MIPRPKTYHRTKHGRMMLGDSLDVLKNTGTSPPTSMWTGSGLLRKRSLVC